MEQCPNCGAAIKTVPEGISKTSGKHYNAFKVCSNRSCGWKPPREFTRPANVPPYQGKPLTPPRFDIQEKILEQLQQTHILLEKIGGLLAKAVGEKKEEYNEEEYDRPF